ncbi:gastrin-releasing peptide receptor-like [Patiria miniata]|uniref:G-protein coupled receptors family 1 profile domain-containing protein n=1 Tax=Patiria miniata TaxID=46514 RepID=A0A913ZVK2_PATMI|nr:gastrin-releasing peptide receptor-like [Patiria miniata]
MDNNGSNITSDFNSEPDWPLVIRDAIFFIIGFAGNVCLIFIALRYKSMRTVPNYLITNLAVVDLVFICLFLPTEILNALNLNLSRYDFFKSEAHCTFYRYIMNVFVVVSIFTLTALSIDRYLAVSKPLACRSLRSGRRRLCAVLLGIVLIWSAAFVISIPVIMVTKLTNEGKCLPRRHSEVYRDFMYASIVIILLIPTTIISTSYCCTAKNLLKSNSLLESQNAVQVSPRQRRQRLRLAIAIVVIVVVFVSTWTLYYSLEVLFWIDGGVHYLDEKWQIYPAVNVFNSIANTMIRINSVINPIILFVVSSAHRRHFKSAFCSCFPGRTNDDRKQWMQLYKNASITVHSSLESETRRSRADNSRLTVDHEV